MIKKMEELVQEIRPSFEAIKWEDPKEYANWLSQAYFIARRSTSFLGLCLFHSEKYPEFQARCADHIAEETGHEKLLLNDIKVLNQELHKEMPSTMAFYQPQYFRIVAENPLSFLGYVFFLELLGPTFGDYLMERAAKADKRSLSFLKVHTHADEHHLESAMQVVLALPEKYQADMWTNFYMSRDSYRHMLDCMASMKQHHKKTA